MRTGLIRIFRRSQIEYKAILSDNGKEFKGSQKHQKHQKQINGYYKAKTKPEGQQHAVTVTGRNEY